MKINLPRDVSDILSAIKKAGFEANVVGGCVRDALLGTFPQDWDICTSASPEKIMDIFSSYSVIPTGISHGTVTVLINKKPYEITTYRSEGKYLDNRHPSHVEFVTSLKLDLLRRDFTINALCYNEETGLTDLCGGVADLNNKVIRCVGTPETRFSEDSLRILRGLRFASVLGFEIEEKTRLALFSKKQLLKNVSAERINAEFFKLLEGKFAEEILNAYKDIFFVFLPPSQEFSSGVSLLAKCKDTSLKKAVFFSGLYKNTPLLSSVLKGLKCDNKTIDFIKKVAHLLEEPLPQTLSHMRFLVYKYGYDITKSVMDFKGYKNLYLLQIKEENLCCSLKALNICGNDISHLKGKAVGRALNLALFAVMEEKIPNKKESLLKYINSLSETDYE